MSRKVGSRLLQAAAGASSYCHDPDNINGGDQGGGSSTQQALSDISSSRSEGSLSLGGVDRELQKPLLLLDDADVNLDKTTADHIIVNNTNNSNNFPCHRSINHGDIMFQADTLINFKNGSAGSGSFLNGKGSLLSFDQNHQIRISQHKDDDDDDSFIWEDDDDNIMSCYVDNNSRGVIPTSDPKGSYSSSRILDQISNYNFQPGSSSSSSCGWLYSDSTVIAADRVQGTRLAERTLSKRPYMGDQSSQPSKKQCTTIAKSSSSKPNKPASSKDPQSMAAKNRRERISERLKILQELVPNGPKVDLVTMLDKAISYVKFLQLQVKVLATDEFWPAQGGKAPDIGQVKEAIDAILASQRERSSSSKR